MEPAFLKKRDVRAEIDRLSAKFGQRAREIWLPERDGLPRAVIAVWGKIDLEQLDPTAVANVASGGRERGLLNFSGSGLYSVLDLGSKEIQEFSFGSVTVMSYDSCSIGLLI